MTKRKIPKTEFKRVGEWCDSNNSVVCNTRLRAADLKVYQTTREGRYPLRIVDVK